jgi:hypothetical protein
MWFKKNITIKEYVISKERTMFFAKNIYVIVILSMMLAVPAFAATNDLTLKDIVYALSVSEKSVKSAKLELKYNVLFTEGSMNNSVDKSIENEQYIDCYFDGNKKSYKVNIKDKGKKFLYEEWAYNGKHTRIITYSKNNKDMIVPVGYEYEGYEAESSLPEDRYNMLYYINMPVYKLSSVMNEIISNGSFYSIYLQKSIESSITIEKETELINNDECVVIIISMGVGKDKIVYKYWISKTIMQPIKYEIDLYPYKLIQFVSYQNYGNVTYPSRSILEQYIQKNTIKEYTLINKRQLDLISIEPNKEIDSNSFEITFPKGIRVHKKQIK